MKTEKNNLFRYTCSAFLIAMVFACCNAAWADVEFECPYRGPVEEAIHRIEVTHYLLDITVDVEDQSISGRVDISMKASPEEDLLYDVPLDLVELTVDEVLADGAPAEYEYDGREILVELPNPLSAGEVFQISVSYHGDTGQGLNWRLGNAFNDMVEASRWFPCYHEPDMKCTADMRFTVPEDYFAASNGLLVEEIENPDATKTYVWQEIYPIATYLVTVNIDQYVSFTEEYPGVPMRFYVFPEDLEKAEVDFENAGVIMGFFESMFGPYPFDRYGIAEVRMAGAMENQEMVSYGKIFIKGDKRFEDTFAHEMSHMWWGDSLTLTDCVDVWLNEGFATYCEALWEEFNYGEEAYKETMETFKENYFEEDEHNRFPIRDPEIIWGCTTYEKGAWVLHMLRHITGDEPFEEILQQYYEDFKYMNPTTADFQAVCESVHGESLEWFFDPWLNEAGYPEYLWDWKIEPENDNKFRLFVTVDQEQENAPLFRMPIDLHIVSGEETQIKTVIVDGETNNYSFILDDEPNQVQFDPDEYVLKKTNRGALPRETLILLAGYVDTVLSSSAGGRLKIWALLSPEVLPLTPEVELYYNGVPAGVFLFDDGSHDDGASNDGLYGIAFDVAESSGLETGSITGIEMRAIDAFGNDGPLWPYLKVRDDGR